MGYVTAGFWGGITLGRFALVHAARRLGEKIFTIGTIIGCIAFEVVVWKLASVVGDAVFIVLIGLLLGPIYPCASFVFARLILPRSRQATALAFISSAGSSGGAVAPLVTGLIAQVVKGTWVLHPVALVCYVVMLGCWVGLPKVRKRRE